MATRLIIAALVSVVAAATPARAQAPAPFDGNLQRLAEIGDEDMPKYQLKEPRGVLIRHVVAGQPADKGGVKAEDVILAVDGAQIEGPRDLQRIISTTPVGRTVKLNVMRAGKETEVAVIIGPYQATAVHPQPRRVPVVPAPKSPAPAPAPAPEPK